VHWTAQPTRSEAGAAIGFTLTFHDVTQEREVSRMKSDFVSFVTHQLRTPLAGIKWMLELTSKEPDVPPDAQSYVQDAREAAQRLIHLVNDLLGISRIQMGKIELEMGEVDLCEVAKSVVEEFGNAAEEKGIGLHASCPTDGVPVVPGDKQKLRDSVLNLVDNAIRYTDKGSVEVSVRREINDLVVRVEDTGPGLDADEARKLFESFQRGDVGRKHWAEGSGLGLYIAREFIALHGGAIWAESPGKGLGSTFVIRIPLGGKKLAA